MNKEPKRSTMTVKEAAKRLGIGRDQGYAAAHLGQIPTIKIGKRLLVPVVAFENMLANAGTEKSAKTLKSLRRKAPRPAS